MLKQIVNAFKNKNTKEIVSFFVLIIVIFSGVVSIFTYGLGINSFDANDFFDGEIWAIETLKSGKIVNPSFYYPYIIPFGANILLLPFVKMFGIGMLANQLGMLVFYIIYLFAITSLAKSLFDDFNYRCVFITISSLFVYMYAGENILHHILYYGLAYVCSVGALSCVINIINSKNKVMNYVGLIVWCLWSSSNGIATVALTNCALLGTVGIYILIKNKNLKSVFEKNNFILLLTITVTTIFGYVLYIFVTRNALDLGGVSSRFSFVDLNSMIKNITTYLMNDYFRCFYAPLDEISLTSFNGLVVIAGFIFGLITLFSFIVLTIINIKKYNDSYLLILLNSMFIMLVCMGEYILTSSNERYLFNIILFSFILCSINIVLAFKNKILSKLVIIGYVCLICAFSIKNIYLFFRNWNIYNNQLKVVETLEDNNLEYGLAKNPFIYNIISKGQIKCLSINEVSMGKVINNTDFDFYKNGCPKGTKEFFMLFPKSRYNVLLVGHEDFLNNAKNTIVVKDEYYIIIFDIEYWNQIGEHGYAIAQRS